MTPSLAADIAPYLLSVTGILLIYILNGIKSEIKEIRVFISTLEGNLRDEMTGLDKRMRSIELRCASEHGHTMVGEK